MGMAVVDDGQASMETGASSGKGMPMQLSKHRSNLSKVSKRPDVAVAAAMNAVRESWIAEQQLAKSMLDIGDSAQSNEVLQARTVESDANHQTNFDSV